jgi:hypothetical protein
VSSGDAGTSLTVTKISAEDTEEAIAACEAALEFYGGVFRVLVPDNTKAILGRAHREGRVLVTLDKDFGELAVVRRQPHPGNRAPRRFHGARASGGMRPRAEDARRRVDPRRHCYGGRRPAAATATSGN